MQSSSKYAKRERSPRVEEIGYSVSATTFPLDRAGVTLTLIDQEGDDAYFNIEMTELEARAVAEKLMHFAGVVKASVDVQTGGKADA